MAVATCPEAQGPPRPAPPPTRPRAHPSAGSTPRAAAWQQTAREASERGAVSGLRAAGDGKLCCSPRFPGPAPSPLPNLAIPRPPLQPRTPLLTHPTAPRSAPPRLCSGGKLQSAGSQAPCLLSAWGFQVSARNTFPSGGRGRAGAPRAAVDLLHGGPRPPRASPTLVYPAKGLPRASAALLAFVFIS